MTSRHILRRAKGGALVSTTTTATQFACKIVTEERSRDHGEQAAAMLARARLLNALY